MIELLKMIEDLKEIKSLLGAGANIGAMNKIETAIASYQKEVDEFEKWAEIESQKDQLKVEEQMEMPFPEGYGSTQKH